MNCVKCNKELSEGIVEINPFIPKEEGGLIYKCPNCDAVIEECFKASSDFSKNNPGKNFKIIAKIVNPMENK